tara:strand:+ start:182 stop:322 length:141 start_codon:yes stop_codon:yes gene_type:complete
MGFFKKLFLGGVAAKTYQNVYNRAIVIPPLVMLFEACSKKALVLNG